MQERRLAPGVVLPSSGAHADYVALIGTLPAQDTPMLFGLPSNADSFVQSRVAGHLQDTLRQLGTDSQAASAFDPNPNPNPDPNPNPNPNPNP